MSLPPEPLDLRDAAIDNAGMRRMIVAPGELPELGSGHEHQAVDFKSHIPERAAFELAKDVAAFANAAGGCLIHRAHEDRRTKSLGRYESMTSEEAGRVVDAYDQSIKDRCFPAPSWFPAKLDHDGGILVAINVQPFPGQLVGVKVRGDKEDGFGDSAYVFPVRIGTQTRCLQPGELAMYMVPQVRMTVVALEGIPEKDRQRVTLIQHVGSSRQMPKDDAQIAAVEPEKNALRFSNGVTWPINRIRAVWHNGRQWCISVDEADMG